MRAVFDAFWRALVYCLHPRVMLWSLLPVVLAGGALALAGWYGWEAAVDGVRHALERWQLTGVALDWLAAQRANELRAVLAPLVVVALAVPLVVVVILLLVGASVTPAIVRLVERRRFPGLERRHGASALQSVAWGLACALAALAALAVSVPLWVVPPLAMAVPPLVWGWLTGRVLAFDSLAAHASAEERRVVMHARRWALLVMGLACGCLGTLPALLWVAGAIAIVFAPLLLVGSVWLYTLVFAFAACWFAHYTLAELQRLRDAVPVALPVAAPAPAAAPAALPAALESSP
jgi:hypothetical protein